MAEEQVTILGSGPAGWTAAIYAARANLDPLLITGSSMGGQLMTTTDVDNWPADNKGVQGPDLMERFSEHALRFNTRVVQDYINEVDLSSSPFHLYGDDKAYKTQTLIIATGANAKYLGLKSEQDYLGRGVSACATCDGFFYRNKTVLVVGGGNTAVEEALYLSGLASKVIMVHRRQTFRAEAIMQDHLYEQVQAGKIELKLNCVLQEVLGDEAGVTAVRILHVEERREETISLEGVFIAIGHKPNTEIFAKSLKMLADGYIETGQNNVATATSVAGVFAAGDVQDYIYRQAVTSAATGCMAALDAKNYLQSKMR